MSDTPAPAPIQLDPEVMIEKLMGRLNQANLINVQLETIIEMKDREIAELQKQTLAALGSPVPPA